MKSRLICDIPRRHAIHPPLQYVPLAERDVYAEAGLLFRRACFFVICSSWLTLPSVALSVEPPAADDVVIEKAFNSEVRPLLSKYCAHCHNVDEMKSGIRVDQLDGTLPDRHLRLWAAIKDQLVAQTMPPEDERQPTSAERKRVANWITQALVIAKRRPQEKNGSVRRLTVSQYRHTLKHLLGLEEDLTDVLPPDATSKEGFTNNSQSMQLSPLQVEAYFSIAEEALDRCIVDVASKPAIQNFRVELGKAINDTPCPDKLILGANSLLLANDDFVVRELTPTKPFDFEPFRMTTQYRFHEGYQGNATVRGWRDYNSIYHAVFACMRGNRGYPKGQAYETVPSGLLLRPAIPSAEMFQVQSTYGPLANFKISLRELPDHGNFRVTVNAAKYEDGLLLERGSRTKDDSDNAVVIADASQVQDVEISESGVYQVDVHPSSPKKKKPQLLSLQIGDRHFSGTLHQPAFMTVRLPAEKLLLSATCGGQPSTQRIVFTRLESDDPTFHAFQKFERRTPHVGVHIGLRRDCGSTMSRVETPQRVSVTTATKFVFTGAINNFPSPDLQPENDNYLAGIREIGVRSEYTDGRDMPRLLIKSVEFEGPLYETWPPETHRRIFFDSENEDDPTEYARDVISSFATRAYRRPPSDSEATSLVNVWQDAYTASNDFQRSIKDALLVVLTSPQFLFLIEASASPEAEELDSYEVASKLSYFLWNSPPDDRLLTLAKRDRLGVLIDDEVNRMIDDPRFERFIDEFASQWLSLHKLDVVETDRKRYPQLTRDTRTHLRDEPAQFLKHLIRGNLPVQNLVRSNFTMANEVVASYYGMGEKTESGFAFEPITHDGENLGGLLTQAGILAGLSDGRESNPVKRGAWLARKIIAEPPDDPPPNVPALDEDTTKLTLRQRLEQHRNQPGCGKCHEGIDPWGVPFEQFDAGGLLKKNVVDSSSTLPDATEVADVRALKAYLANDRIDQVAFSFVKHLATYAVGRTLTYNEIEFLRTSTLELEREDYRMRDLVHFVINSKVFAEK